MLKCLLWGVLASFLSNASALKAPENITKEYAFGLIPLVEVPEKMTNFIFLAPKNCTDNSPDCLPHRKNKLNRMYNQMLYLLDKSYEAQRRVDAAKETLTSKNMLSDEAKAQMVSNLVEGINMLQHSTSSQLKRSGRTLADAEQRMASQIKSARDWFTERSIGARDAFAANLQRIMHHVFDSDVKMLANIHKVIAESTKEITRAQEQFPVRATREVQFSRGAADLVLERTRNALARLEALRTLLKAIQEHAAKRRDDSFLSLSDSITRQNTGAVAALAILRRKKGNKAMRGIRGKAATLVKESRMLDKQFSEAVVGQRRFKRRMRKLARVYDVVMRNEVQSLAQDIVGLASSLEHVTVEGKKAISAISLKRMASVTEQSSIADTVQRSVLRQTGLLDSAEKDLARTSDGVGGQLSREVANEIHRAITEADALEGATTTMEKHTEDEARLLKRQAWGATSLARQRIREEKEQSQQSGDAINTLLANSRGDMRQELQRRADIFERRIASMQTSKEGAIDTSRRGMAMANSAREKAITETSNTLEAQLSRLGRDVGLLLGDEAASVKKKVDAVRMEEGSQESARSQDMKHLKSTLAKGATATTEQKASFKRLSEARKKFSQEIDGSSAEEAARIRSINDGLGPTIALLKSSRQKSEAAYQKEVHQASEEVTEGTMKTIKEIVRNATRPLRADLEALLRERQDDGTKTVLLDREVSKVIRDVKLVEAENLKHLTKLQGRIRSFLSSERMTENAMAAEHKADHGRLIEVKRQAVTAKIISAVAELSGSLNALLSVINKKIRETEEANTSEENRQEDSQATIKALKDKLDTMDDSVELGVGEMMSRLNPMRGEDEIRQEKDLLRSKEAMIAEQMSASSREMEESVSESEKTVRKQNSGLRRLLEAFTNAMEDILRQMARSIDDHRSTKSEVPQDNIIAQKVLAELNSTEGSFKAKLTLFQKDYSAVVQRLAQALEDINAALRNTQQWANITVSSAQKELEGFAEDRESEIEKMSTELENDMMNRKSAMDSIAQNHTEEVNVLRSKASARIATAEVDLEKLGRDISEHLSAVEVNFRNNAAKIAGVQSNAREIAEDVLREAEEERSSWNSTISRLNESQWMSKADNGKLIDEILKTLYSVELPVWEGVESEVTDTIQELSKFAHANITASRRNTGFESTEFGEKLADIQRRLRRHLSDTRPLRQQMKRDVHELNKEFDITNKNLSALSRLAFEDIDDVEGKMYAMQSSLNHQLQQAHTCRASELEHVTVEGNKAMSALSLKEIALVTELSTCVYTGQCSVLRATVRVEENSM
ncbi:hypothetical protein FOL47_002242 [Perkinsus chesapeaki]|uniref:Uncharacterized protein n=1 Tax=Perkinsus chesapeaki TaxID=330153 RepID=A0A7J6N124_PERCH|nr:hypothetical protein FOL47_002242 [Perkinsus chesapeaki]